MKFLRQVLIENGYSKNTISKAMKPKKTRTNTPEKGKDIVAQAVLPYVKGVTDRIGRILKKHKIKTTYTPHSKIQGLLRNPKDRIPLENQGVYEIFCNNCDSSYVGQTNRRISVRLEEHKHAVRQGLSTSSLAQHVKLTGHSIDFENAKTIANIEHLTCRVAREAIEIEKRPNCMNVRDDSIRLPAIWKIVLRQHKAEPKKMPQARPSKKPGVDQQVIQPAANKSPQGRITRSRARTITQSQSPRTNTQAGKQPPCQGRTTRSQIRAQAVQGPRHSGEAT